MLLCDRVIKTRRGMAQDGGARALKVAIASNPSTRGIAFASSGAGARPLSPGEGAARKLTQPHQTHGAMAVAPKMNRADGSGC